MNVLELFNSLAWGALGWLLSAATLGPLGDMGILVAAGATLLAIGVPGIAWMLRSRPV